MLSTINGFYSILYPLLSFPKPQFHQSTILNSRFLPSQNPFLSIRAETDTCPSGMNMQETFFSFLADTGAYIQEE